MNTNELLPAPGIDVATFPGILMHLAKRVANRLEIETGKVRDFDNEWATMLFIAAGKSL